MLSDIEKRKIKYFGDSLGGLNVIENRKDIPFDVKRVFYIYGTDKNVIRGLHANKNSEFVMISLVGSCYVDVIDPNENKKKILLDNPNEYLYIPKMLWKNMYGFSQDSVLLVLSDSYYDENEYIRDFEDYKSEYGDKI